MGHVNLMWLATLFKCHLRASCCPWHFEETLLYLKGLLACHFLFVMETQLYEFNCRVCRPISSLPSNTFTFKSLNEIQLSLLLLWYAPFNKVFT